MFVWWRHLSVLAKIAGIAGAISGAIVSVAAAWPLVEWAFPAHRGLVYDKVGGVQTTTNELLIWKFEDSKSRLKSEMGGWTIQLQKETDPAQKALIQQRIRDLDREQSSYDDRIRRLRSQ